MRKANATKEGDRKRTVLKTDLNYRYSLSKLKTTLELTVYNFFDNDKYAQQSLNIVQAKLYKAAQIKTSSTLYSVMFSQVKTASQSSQ